MLCGRDRGGVLTRAQSEAASEDPPPAPAAGAAPRVEAHSVYLGAPCGTVYTLSGSIDAPECPVCHVRLKLMRVGRILGPASAALREQTFGKYVLKRELGRGGMGIAYEAEDRELGRSVARKMLVAADREMDKTAVERLVREARTVARLRHPSIVGIHDVEQVEGRHSFTMDLLEGNALGDLLNRPEFPLELKVRAVAEFAEALGYPHGQGLVHRDVKPGNILIDPKGRAILMDFGLVRDVTGAGTPTLTVTGAVVGTPSCMSPEQARARTGTSARPARRYPDGSALAADRT